MKAILFEPDHKPELMKALIGNVPPGTKVTHSGEIGKLNCGFRIVSHAPFASSLPASELYAAPVRPKAIVLAVRAAVLDMRLQRGQRNLERAILRAALGV